MLTPDYLLYLGDPAAELMDEFSSSVIEGMSRRIVRVGMSSASVYQAERLMEMGYLSQDILASIQALTGGGEDSELYREVEAALTGAANRSTASDVRIYRQAGIITPGLQESPALLRLLQIGIVETGGSLTNLTRSTVLTSQTAFLNATNIAYVEVTSGVKSYTQAIVDAIRKMAGDGTYVLYPSGHRDTIEVATRRAVVTGANQTAGNIQLANVSQYGSDFVETTAHYGARPTHQPWQGRVFRVSTGEFERVTGYGTGAGLCGWNCRHSFFPYFVGLSGKAYNRDEIRAIEEATVTYNREEMPLYTATQKQRQYERDIRKTKRQLLGYEAGMEGANESLRAALQQQYNLDALNLKRQRDKLYDFEQQTGLPSQSEREQVYGFGRSEASRATWAAKRAM